MTQRKLASDRLTFQPDWNFSLSSDYVIPMGAEDDLTLSATAIGKGSRIAATLSETNAPVLKSYVLVNSAVTWRHGDIELSAFADNLLNKNYMESYIEKTTLILAGLTPTDVGIAGDKRRYGLRARVQF